MEFWVDVPWRSAVIKEREEWLPRAVGKAGLGVELNYDKVAKHPPKETRIDFFTKYRYH